MEIHENGGISYHLDDIAKGLAQKYNPSRVSKQHCLTGNYGEECALLPFVLAAFNTGQYWGFDINGYNSVVDIFSNTDAGADMSFARGVVRGNEDLAKLAKKGYLRLVEHKGNAVYFPSERLVDPAAR